MAFTSYACGALWQLQASFQFFTARRTPTGKLARQREPVPGSRCVAWDGGHQWEHLGVDARAKHCEFASERVSKLQPALPCVVQLMFAGSLQF